MNCSRVADFVAPALYIQQVPLGRQARSGDNERAKPKESRPPADYLPDTPDGVTSGIRRRNGFEPIINGDVTWHWQNSTAHWS